MASLADYSALYKVEAIYSSIRSLPWAVSFALRQRRNCQRLQVGLINIVPAGRSYVEVVWSCGTPLQSPSLLIQIVSSPSQHRFPCCLRPEQIWGTLLLPGGPLQQGLPRSLRGWSSGAFARWEAGHAKVSTGTNHGYLCLATQITDAESLSQTWKLCTKVAAHLDQGERLENLSWRLFYLHSVLASESPSASPRIFKMLSAQTGQKLDREKHLRLSQLKAPPFKGKTGDMCKEEVQSSGESIMHGLPAPINSPANNAGLPMGTAGQDFSFTTPGAFNFESFLSSFSPLALFSAINYLSYDSSACEASQKPILADDALAVSSPPGYLVGGDQSLDLLPHSTHRVDTQGHDTLLPTNFSAYLDNGASLGTALQPIAHAVTENAYFAHLSIGETVESMQILPSELSGNMDVKATERSPIMSFTDTGQLIENAIGQGHEVACYEPSYQDMRVHLSGQPQFAQDRDHQFNKPKEKRKRRNPMATRPPTFIGALGGAEQAGDDGFLEGPVCSNCQGTQTPLWRRGPNDELLCNACGVFYKVHKKNRPGTLSKCRYPGSTSSNTTSERDKRAPIECTNCGAKATPMWRKAPDGKLMCNACALYLKCHKRARPVVSNGTSTSRADKMGETFGGLGKSPAHCILRPEPTLMSPYQANGFYPQVSIAMPAPDFNVGPDISSLSTCPEVDMLHLLQQHFPCPSPDL